MNSYDGPFSNWTLRSDGASSPQTLTQSLNSTGTSEGAAPPRKSLTAAAVLPWVIEIGKLIANYFTNRRNEKNAKDAADLAYDRQVEQWNRENAYNSPSSQLKRYAQAGLNPNLIYGGSGAEAGNAGGLSDVSPSYMSGRWSMPDISANALTVAQAQNLNAQTARIDKLNGLTDTQIESMLQNIKESDSRIDVNKQSIEGIKTQMQLNLVNCETGMQQYLLLGEQRASLFLSNLLSSRTLRDQVRIWSNKAHISDVDAEFYYKSAVVGLAQAYATLNNTDVDTLLKHSNIKLNDTQAGLNNAIAGYYTEVGRNEKLLNDAGRADLTIQGMKLQNGVQARQFKYLDLQNQIEEKEKNWYTTRAIIGAVSDISSAASSWFAPIKLGGAPPAPKPIGFR